MEHAIKDLDRLLRGDATRLANLRRGAIEVSESGLPLLICLLGIFYGLCMGCYALSSRNLDFAIFQTIAVMAKVPALFLTTFLVTFPSLYVFNALVGSRLSLHSLWRLLLATLAVMLAVLASLGPIVAFFAFSTTSYAFMLLLNVAIFGLAGFLGLKFLLHTLHRLTIVLYESAPPYADLLDENSAMLEEKDINLAGKNTNPAERVTQLEEKAGALDKSDRHSMSGAVRQVFTIWIFVFGLVGAQMSWVLRPFLASPAHQTFVLFSPRESNFYAAVFGAIRSVLGF